jgi:hypothetical protein
VRTAAPLAEVSKTRFLPTRGGSVQCWSAVTTDGLWGFDREDMPGTPWSVTHLPTGTVVDRYVGTLDDCRAYVASGEALADLERLRAHERGEHESERDRACVKC